MVMEEVVTGRSLADALVVAIRHAIVGCIVGFDHLDQ